MKEILTFRHFDKKDIKKRADKDISHKEKLQSTIRIFIFYKVFYIKNATEIHLLRFCAILLI